MTAHPLEAYAESYDMMTRIAEREGREPSVSPTSVAVDIRQNMIPATGSAPAAQEPVPALTTGQILALERRSNMTDDEAIRFARGVESAVPRLVAPIAAQPTGKPSLQVADHDLQRAVDAYQIAEQACIERHCEAGNLVEPGMAVEAGLLAAAPFLADPAVMDGWRLVPVKPTDDMLAAAQSAWLADPAKKSSTLYCAMLAAAPTPPVDRQIDELANLQGQAQQYADIKGCAERIKDSIESWARACDSGNRKARCEASRALSLRVNAELEYVRAVTLIKRPGSTLPYERALLELIDKINPALDTGDILADARAASAALDRQGADESDRLFVLIAEIRAACGDGGQRMQPALIEYIAGIWRDAQSWRKREDTL